MSVLTQGTIISSGETKCRGLGEGGAGGGWWAMGDVPGSGSAWGFGCVGGCSWAARGERVCLLPLET